MCGFVGVVRDPALGPVTREELDALLPDLRARGPDGSGVVLGRGVGLAATRLAIQGDRRSDQPVVSAGGRLALAFNGELLATQQGLLRRLLLARGRESPEVGAGDSALLLAAFEHAHATEGEAGLPPFARGLDLSASVLPASVGLSTWDLATEGMGALALVDLERGVAWLGRDRLGVKPLHLLELRTGETWFASTLTPLLRVQRLHGAPVASVAGVEALRRFQDAWAAPLGGLSTLPGGEARRLTAGATKAVPVAWRTAARASAAGAPRAAFAAALERAARQAADVAGPVVLFLSGGLDSGAVAALCGRPDVVALTGRFQPHGDDADESGAARAVSQALGLRHEVVDLDDAALVADLEPVVRALELPVGGPGALALWRLALRARELARVVLTGTGGDELLGGYARNALVLGRAGDWTRGYEGLAARLAAEASPGRRAWAALDRSADLDALLEPGFRAELVATRGDDGPPPERLPSLDELRGLELRYTLPALLHVEDRVLMAHGLEGRPVFCLGDVPTAALALPPDERIGPDGEGKVALRRLLAGRIPESVRLDRKKRGFPTPFGRAARGAGRERVEALLADRRFRERGWWNVAACRALLDEERPPHDRALFALLSWETWARLFLDGDVFRTPATPAPPSPAPPSPVRPSPGAPVTPGARGR